jgi:N-methylhydantoinase B
VIATIDPIALELLRSRVESIAEDAAITIERTGVSPTATETHDLSATLLDAEGRLIAGGGWVSFHWVAATNAVRATLARHGDTLAPGDVFLANDPYNGGGLHPNDVFVERPIFLGDRLVAWVALSAHLADMGGMATGSFAPTATDCFQEAFRVPPVHLFRGGVEVSDVWDLLRVNVRLPWVVEMDLRALVAGAHVAQDKVAELVGTMGIDAFVDGVRALQQLSERELRKRISTLPDGIYRSVGWVDWDDELYRVPCALTVEGDHLVFDFEGAAPQASHFINSQPYIIKSAMVMHLARLLGADLPYSEGLLSPIELRCPEGSVVHATPPAPMNAGHMHVGLTAAEMMLQCLRLAAWAADPPLPMSRFVHGWGGSAGISLAIWSGTHVDGTTTIWGMTEGTHSGGTAGIDRDGADVTVTPVGMPGAANDTDVEILESWHPILIRERGLRGGLNGAGAHRSGRGVHVRFEPYGTAEMTGEMLGLREWLPLHGAAGGFPGSTSVYRVTRADGTTERISTKASGLVLHEGDVYELDGGSGGGVGDPLDRLPDAVTDDVATRQLDPADADGVYGVVLHPDGTADPDATAARRAELRAARLARATPPLRPVDGEHAADGAGEPMPLYPGVIQRGRLAFAERSGTPLAVAPDHWTDGCAVLEETQVGGGPEVVLRTYLDPRTGTSLYVEAVPAGDGRGFEVSPQRWTAAE